ncbi:hypothetical protein [Methylocystis iwaonis]|uniref:Uncharacterized protein n=1 Tax=Methylocystis iwaonis TaxID=2885079 RepID=A0ABM8EER2_9HYPH|nr:hypothetical protein [Methylocystis iwaonis]BDV36532.1 hypothetical protein SS37A_40620 [Methylocystis iwaonis]
MQIAGQLAAGHELSRAVLVFVVALLIGLLTLAAVASMRTDCSTENTYLGTQDGSYLVTENGERMIIGQEQQCHLLAGPFRLPLWRLPLP